MLEGDRGDAVAFAIGKVAAQPAVDAAAITTWVADMAGAVGVPWVVLGPLLRLARQIG
ncbi:MAG: hypothetical protein ACRDRO_14395 [Pseudonocardiaceae bacterium]